MSEVEMRTVPNVRADADAETFVKDYLAYVDDSSKPIPDDLIVPQYADMQWTARQRGMHPTGDAELIDTKVVDAHNVLLVYSIPVIVAPDSALDI